MKKILKTALATFFTLIVCFPDLFVLSADKGKGKKIAPIIFAGGVSTGIKFQRGPRSVLNEVAKKRPRNRQALKLWQARKEKKRCDEEAARAKEEAARAKEEVARAEEKLRLVAEKEKHLSKICEFISKIEFMCVCPNPYEFLAAYNGLAEKFEECNFTETEEDSENLNELIENLYTKEQREDWRRDECSKGRVPLCFFKIEGQVLCLAWCGKRSGPVTSFFERLKLFKNLKHIFICGICGCPTRDVEVGSVFLGKKFVNIKSFTMGGASSAISKGKAIYLFGQGAYFMRPDFFSYENEDSFLPFIEKARSWGIPITPAIIFSFECFMDDPVLAHQLEWRGLEEGGICIVDTESAQIVAWLRQNWPMCTVWALRVASDHIGLKIGEILNGKDIALSTLSEVLGPSLEFWMRNPSDEFKLVKEERFPKRPSEANSLNRDIASEDRLSIVFYTPEGWLLRTVSHKTLEYLRRKDVSSESLDESIPGNSPKFLEVRELLFKDSRE